MDSKLKNFLKSNFEGKYYNLNQLKPILCGNSGISLRPIDFELALNDNLLSFIPELFKSSPRVQKFLPTIDLSNKESIQKFAMLASTRTESGIEFTYGIYLNNLLVGMIFVNTPGKNKYGMGLEQWTIDFFLFEAFEGHGLMGTALPRMLLFLKQAINVNDIYFLIDTDNIRCLKFISNFPFDEIDNSGFKNIENKNKPPRVFNCPLSIINFKKF